MSRPDRVPPPLTAARLDRVAARYLGRFSASVASLRRVLIARVDRSAEAHGTDRAEGRAWVEALIERYRRAGMVDDTAYAGTKALGLRRRGGSAQAIRDWLGARGISGEAAAAAVAAADSEAGTGEGETAERAAAQALARRRRLGPFRPADQRAANRLRDLAALGRAGFSYEIARAVIDAEE